MLALFASALAALLPLALATWFTSGAWSPARVGDPTYLLRVGVCLVVGALATLAVYWLWPAPLSIWPGAAMMLASALAGVLWEWRSGDAEQPTLK